MPSPFRRWTAIFSVLATNVDLRAWWIVIGVSNVGTWMQVVAQDWLVLVVLDAGPAALGIVTALQTIPAIVAAPLGGMLADRFAKRYVLMATNAISGVLSAALGVLVIAGTAEVWHVYLMALLLGTARAIDGPARLTLGAELVDVADVPKAVGLSSISFNLARLAGPGLGGLLIAGVGTGPVFMINAATFVVPCLALVWIGRSIRRGVRSKRSGMGDALRYAWHRPHLRAIILLMFFSGFVMNMPMIMALMANDVYRVDAAAFGILGSIMAIGSLLGTLYAGSVSPRVRTVMYALTSLGVLLVLQSLMPAYLAFAMTLPVAGALSAIMNVSAYSFVQLAADAGQRGRVTALATMAAAGGQPVGALLTGWIAGIAGAPFGVMACGLIAVVGVGLTFGLLAGSRPGQDGRV